MIRFIYNSLTLEDIIAIHEARGAEIVINNGMITEIIIEEKRDGDLRFMGSSR